MSKKKSILDNAKRQRISDRVLILTLFVQMLILVNQSIGIYTVAAQSIHASMIEPTGETLEIRIETDTGRLNLVEKIIRGAREWIGSYFVGGVEKTNAETGITISVTGSNVASQASVTYYVEGVPQSGGQAYRFLEGNGTSITVGGSSLNPTNQTTIGNHLTAMGLNITASHTIDYYVYVKAEVAGAVSGETLTSEITYTKFDTVTYEYGTLIQETYHINTNSDDGQTYYYTSLGGRINNGGKYLWIGDYSTSWYDNAAHLRYTSVDLPRDQTINTAYLELKNLYYYSGSSATTISIIGEDAASPTFITSYGDCYSRPRTDAYTEWEIPYSTTPTTLTSPDMSGIISEIIAREDWDSGDTVQLFVTDLVRGYNLATVVEFDTYDEASNLAPELHVSYITYSASWYPLPPLSLASLPITLDVVAMSALIIATALALRENRRKNK